MESPTTAPEAPATFETHPSRYRHWNLTIGVDGDARLARLAMNVREEEPLRPGYTLKLNSYDLGVDIELCDAVQRLRFEHPEVRAVILTSDRDRAFCAGANIHMLASSTHGFKVNFCKYTNETRLAIEDAAAHSGQRYLAAVNGPCAGGGYELAMACDEILLVDDGSSTVSLPEVPLLAVLPGTGGLTRLVDKRRVRRDRADVFATLAEGLRGKRAVEWRLIDGTAPRSRFAAETLRRARLLADQPAPTAARRPVPLPELNPTVGADSVRYRHVTLQVDRARRLATLSIAAPDNAGGLGSPGALAEAAAADQLWHLRAARELDDALLRLRFHETTVGLVLLRTSGDPKAMLAADAALFALDQAGDGLARELRLLWARTLRRLDLTARSLFAIGEPGSCFVGVLLEVALAADRTYFLDDAARPVHAGAGPFSSGALPMSTGRSRLATRFLDQPERAARVLEAGLASAPEADELGLVTVLADELDFDDTLRLAIEERLSLSPDALTGMEASLRVPGSEGCESKIFGRLSAWQNWIFTRPNATGEQGALSCYGRPDRPVFDWRRT